MWGVRRLGINLDNAFKALSELGACGVWGGMKRRLRCDLLNLFFKLRCSEKKKKRMSSDPRQRFAALVLYDGEPGA